MADTSTSTTIDFTKVYSHITDWNQAADQFKGSYKKAADDPTLKDLSSAGLESGFISSYDERFEKLADSVKTLGTELQTVVKAFEDEDAAGTTPTITPTDTPRGPGTSGGGDKKPTATEPTATATDPTATDPTPTDQDPDEDHDKVYAEHIKEYETMSMEGLDGLAAELVKYAAQQGITVDELLSNEKYAAKLHSMLLKSPNISDSLKALITDSSTAVTQEALRDVFSGKYPSIVGINNDTASIYLAYLQSIAAANNIDVSDLVTDEKYKDILVASLSDFSKISGLFNGMSDEEIVKRALEIYDGTNISKIDDTTLMILRTYMDVEAEALGKDVQELDASNADIFKNLSKFGSFSAVLAASGTAAIQSGLISVAEAKETPSSTSSTSTTPTTTTSTPTTTSEGVDRSLINEDGTDENIARELAATPSATETAQQASAATPTAEQSSTPTRSEQPAAQAAEEVAEQGLPNYDEIHQEIEQYVEETPAQTAETSASPEQTTTSEVNEIYSADGTLEAVEDTYNADGTISETTESDTANTTISDTIIDEIIGDSSTPEETQYPEQTEQVPTPVEPTPENPTPSDPVVNDVAVHGTDVTDPTGSVYEEVFEEILNTIGNTETTAEGGTV